MDWLEEFFPWLEEIDQGSGALEIALVVLIIGALGVIGLVAVRRRPGATRSVESRDDGAGPDDGQLNR